MPKYRSKVSITLPYKQRFSSVSVSSEAEVEAATLDEAKSEVQQFILADIGQLLDKLYEQELTQPQPKTGPKKIPR